MLGVVAVEHRCARAARPVGASADGGCRRGDRRIERARRRDVDAERPPTPRRPHLGVDVSSRLSPTVSASTPRRLMPRPSGAASTGVGPPGHARRLTVSNHVSVDDVDAAGAQPGGQDRREPVDPLGDAAQPVRTVLGRVEAGDVGQQHLGGADVRRWPSPGGCAARGSGGRGAAPGGPACRCSRRPGGRAATGHGPRARPRNAAWGPPKPIGTPKRWAEPTTMSAPSCAGRRQQHAAPAGRWPPPRCRPRAWSRSIESAPVGEVAARARVGEERTEAALRRRRRAVADHELDADRLGAGAPARRSSADGCRRSTKKALLGAACDPAGHRHRLGRRRAPRRASRRWRDPSRSGRPPSSGS